MHERPPGAAIAQGASDGPRLTWHPVKELETLRGRSHRVEPGPLPSARTRSPTSRPTWSKSNANSSRPPPAEWCSTCGASGSCWTPPRIEIEVGGKRAPAPLVDGRQRIVVLLDRTTIEVFAGDGLIYLPLPAIAAAENHQLSLTTEGAPIELMRLEVFELKSIWPDVQAEPEAAQ